METDFYVKVDSNTGEVTSLVGSNRLRAEAEIVESVECFDINRNVKIKVVLQEGKLLDSMFLTCQ